MDDQSAGTSQYSESILIPESPGSPDVLNGSPPGSPVITWDDAPSRQPDSETFTQANDNAQDVPQIVRDHSSNREIDDLESRDSETRDSETRDTETRDTESRDSNTAQISEDSLQNNDSNTLTTDNVDNSSSTITIAPWRRLTQDNVSESSLPDIQIRKHTNEDKIEEPPAKLRKISSQSNDELDGETCPICLDSWANSGEHRLVSLKCGHLFGLQCVERWLKAQTAKDRSCPTCKTKTTMKDIRNIYARRLVAADTSQITSLQKQLEVIQAEKSRVELELQKSKIAHRACILQLDVLRNTLMKSQLPKEQNIRKSWRFALEKNLEICKDGGCRVLTYNCRTYELYVSQKSTNYLFPGYGIRKVSCVDYKLGQFVHLHPKPIRDIKYSQPRDYLLSVGLDSSARIVERGISTVNVNTGVPLWSCSWDYLRSNEFYVGGVGGVVQQYDIRNPSTFIQRLQAPGDMSPVVSLCSTEYGLLSCQLNSCWLWVSEMRAWEPRSMPLEGPFMSLSYDNESHRALVSCRGLNGDRSKLNLCKLKPSVPSGEILVETEQSFSGSVRSTLMSKSAWVKAPGATWVASHSESDSALYLHGLDGVRTMTLPAAEPALDIMSVQLNGDTILAALSESRLRLYKAVSTNS